MYCNKKISLIFTLSLLIFPILDIIFTSEYSCNAACSDMDISIKEWLYFKAIIMFGNISFMLLFLYSENRTLIKKLYYVILLFIEFFTIIWIIIGIVIFFRSCLNIEPHIFNIFMYFSIISGFIYTISVIFFVFCKRDRKNRKDYPIFTEYDVL